MKKDDKQWDPFISRQYGSQLRKWMKKIDSKPKIPLNKDFVPPVGYADAASSIFFKQYHNTPERIEPMELNKDLEKPVGGVFLKTLLSDEDKQKTKEKFYNKTKGYTLEEWKVMETELKEQKERHTLREEKFRQAYNTSGKIAGEVSTLKNIDMERRAILKIGVMQEITEAKINKFKKGAGTLIK